VLTAARLRRRGRICWLHPVMVVMTVVVPVLAGCTGHPAGHGTGAAGTVGHRPGVPRYYVALVDNPRHPPRGEIPGEVIQVREPATGRLTGTFPLTLRLHSNLYFQYGTLAAAADQRTFFVSYPEDFNFETQTSPVVTDIYRFRLSGAGLITGFARVAQGYGHADGGFSMIAAPDGQKLAMVDPAAGPDEESRPLVTLDLLGLPGALSASGLPGDLSSGAVLSPDGRTITAVDIYSPNSHGESPAPRRDEIIQFSAVTGQQTKVLFSRRSSASVASGLDFGGQLAADGHGHLLQGGMTGGGRSGTAYGVSWFDGGRLHRLPLSLGPASILTGFAW
jgi:hypothetical protein